jgi:hypothetical protein
MKEFNNIKNCRNIWKIIREFANGRQTFGEQNRIICKIENCIDNCFEQKYIYYLIELITYSSVHLLLKVSWRKKLLKVSQLKRISHTLKN